MSLEGRSNANLHILPESSEKIHEALDGVGATFRLRINA